MKKLKSGFYWVKFENSWTIGQYDEDCLRPWLIFGLDGETWNSSDLQEIGKYLTEPK